MATNTSLFFSLLPSPHTSDLLLHLINRSRNAAKSGDELQDEKAAFDDPEKCLVKASPEKEKAPTVTPATAPPTTTTTSTATEKKATTPNKEKPAEKKEPEAPKPTPTITTTEAEEKKSNGAHTPI